jgi:hypothetical protein
MVVNYEFVGLYLYKCASMYGFVYECICACVHKCAMCLQPVNSYHQTHSLKLFQQAKPSSPKQFSSWQATENCPPHTICIWLSWSLSKGPLAPALCRAAAPLCSVPVLSTQRSLPCCLDAGKSSMESGLPEQPEHTSSGSLQAACCAL